MGKTSLRLLPNDQDWTPYAYLIYLAYFAVLPFVFPATALERALTLAATLVSLPLYFTGYWIKNQRILWIVGAFVAMGMALVPSNPGASVFFVYGASFLGKALEPRPAYRYLCAILAIAGLEAMLLHLPAYTWIPAVVFTALVGAVVIQTRPKKRLTGKTYA